MLKPILVAAIATAAMATSASAATLSGDFKVTAFHVTNLNSSESQATEGNFLAASDGSLGGDDSVITTDMFNYSGELDFETRDGTSSTIGSWLLTGTEDGVTGLDSDFATLQLSKGSIGNGTATTTFFLFEKVLNMFGDFTVIHDDGIAIFDDGELLGGRVGPTSKTTSIVKGFTGGDFSLLYVATNSDPSILNVDGQLTPIPLPATLPLLLVGMGGIAMMRRKRA